MSKIVVVGANHAGTACINTMLDNFGHENEIVVYSIGGMPVEDVAWGTMVYRNALKKGIGTKLKLWDVPQMI